MRGDLTVATGQLLEQATSLQQWSDELFMRSQLGQAEYKLLASMSNRVCVVRVRQVGGGEVEEVLLAQICFMMRSVIEQQAFRLFSYIERGHIVLLLIDTMPAKLRAEKARRQERLLQKVAEAIQRLSEVHITIGISSITKGFTNILLCYEEAQRALSLRALFRKPVVYYEELGVFQLLLYLQEQGLLASYVAQHLGPILEEDARKNSDLFQTLKVYLESNGSKKSIADELHIVRQSLYYRLEKIKELLGENYMCTQNRLALQLAIQAYALLNCNEQDR